MFNYIHKNGVIVHFDSLILSYLENLLEFVLNLDNEVHIYKIIISILHFIVIYVTIILLF